jgi:hypothetical protein
MFTKVKAPDMRLVVLLWWSYRDRPEGLFRCGVLGASTCAHPRSTKPYRSKAACSGLRRLKLTKVKPPTFAGGFTLVELQGLKPWTSSMPWKRSSQLSYSPLMRQTCGFSHRAGRRNQSASSGCSFPWASKAQGITGESIAQNGKDF